MRWLFSRIVLCLLVPSLAIDPGIAAGLSATPFRAAFSTKSSHPIFAEQAVVPTLEAAFQYLRTFSPKSWKVMRAASDFGAHPYMMAVTVDGGSAGTKSGKPRILIVDDNPRKIEQIQYALTVFGEDYEFTTAGDGLEGLKKLAAESPFHLIISDLHMPKMGGIEFITKAQKEQGVATPIILYSSDIDADIKSFLQERQVVVFRFIHPIKDVGEFSDAVKNAISGGPAAGGLNKTALSIVLMAAAAGALSGWMGDSTALKAGLISFSDLPQLIGSLLLGGALTSWLLTTAEDPGPTRDYKQIGQALEKLPIHIFMENEARDLSEIGGWVQRDMSLGSVLNRLHLENHPQYVIYEKALADRTRTEAVKIAADGTRVEGVPPVVASELKLTAHVYRRINPPDAFVENIIFRKNRRATSFYMVRGTGDQKDMLLIKPEHFAKKSPRDKIKEVRSLIAKKKASRRKGGSEALKAYVGGTDEGEFMRHLHQIISSYRLESYDSDAEAYYLHGLTTMAKTLGPESIRNLFDQPDQRTAQAKTVNEKGERVHILEGGPPSDTYYRFAIQYPLGVLRFFDVTRKGSNANRTSIELRKIGDTLFYKQSSLPRGPASPPSMQLPPATGGGTRTGDLGRDPGSRRYGIPTSWDMKGPYYYPGEDPEMTGPSDGINPLPARGVAPTEILPAIKALRSAVNPPSAVDLKVDTHLYGLTRQRQAFFAGTIVVGPWKHHKYNAYYLYLDEGDGFSAGLVDDKGKVVAVEIPSWHKTKSGSENPLTIVEEPELVQISWETPGNQKVQISDALRSYLRNRALGARHDAPKNVWIFPGSISKLDSYLDKQIIPGRRDTRVLAEKLAKAKRLEAAFESARAEAVSSHKDPVLILAEVLRAIGKNILFYDPAMVFSDITSENAEEKRRREQDAEEAVVAMGHQLQSDVRRLEGEIAELKRSPRGPATTPSAQAPPMTGGSGKAMAGLALFGMAEKAGMTIHTAFEMAVVVVGGLLLASLIQQVLLLLAKRYPRLFGYGPDYVVARDLLDFLERVSAVELVPDMDNGWSDKAKKVGIPLTPAQYQAQSALYRRLMKGIRADIASGKLPIDDGFEEVTAEMISRLEVLTEGRSLSKEGFTVSMFGGGIFKEVWRIARDLFRRNSRVDQAALDEAGDPLESGFFATRWLSVLMPANGPAVVTASAQKPQPAFSGSYQLKSLSPQEREPLLKDRALGPFIRLAKTHPANKALVEQLEEILKDMLSPASQHPIEIKELTFPSDVTSPWPENNTVHVYGYFPKGHAGPRPVIVIPSYIELDGIARPLSLLFAQRGFIVLEVTLPLFGARTVKGTEDKNAAERYAFLNLGPSEFVRTIENAVSDVAKAAAWARTQADVDLNRIAVLANSHRGNIAILAYFLSMSFTHAVAISPLTNATRIWKRKNWEPYRGYLESAGITQDLFEHTLQSFEGDVQQGVLLPPKKPKNILVAYMPKDDASTPAEIAQLVQRMGNPQLMEIDASEAPDTHVTGLFPAFADVFARIETLLLSDPSVSSDDAPPGKEGEPVQVSARGLGENLSRILRLVMQAFYNAVVVRLLPAKPKRTPRRFFYAA